jgi:hypothetical protein
MEPFWTDSGAGRAGGSGGGHVVTITDYTPLAPRQKSPSTTNGAKAPTTTPQNQYRYMSYTKQSEENRCCHAVRERRKSGQRDAGHPDRVKELDLARLKFLDGKISKEDFEKEIIRISKEIAKMPDGDEKKLATEKLRDTMNSLEPAAALRVLENRKKMACLTIQHTKKHQSPN